MTSKISFHKLLLNDIKQRGWVLALTSVGMFLAMPFLCLLEMQIEHVDDMAVGAAQAKAEASRWLMEFLTYGNDTAKFAVVFAAVICGVSGFVFMHSKEKLDFYHSLPITRGRKFAVQYVSGFLIFAVPFTISQILAYILPFTDGYKMEHVMKNFVVSLVIHILFFLVFYSITILAMMLTGRPVIGALGTAVFFFYPFLMEYDMNTLKGIFFQTYYSGSRWFANGILQVLSSGRYSPFMGYMNFCEPEKDGKLLLFMLGIAVGVSVLCYVLYRSRPSEAAERAIAYRRMEAVIKLFIAVPAGIGIATFVHEAVSWNVWWLIVPGCVSVVLLCCMIEFIYHSDLKLLGKKWKSAGLAVLAALLIFGVFQLDIFRYDVYIPKEKDVREIAIGMVELEQYFQYPSSYYGGAESDVMFPAVTEESRAIMYDMAKNGVARLDHQKEEEDVQFVVRYTLKNGKKVYRSYYLDREEALNYVCQLCENEKMRDKIVPVKNVADKEILSINIERLGDGDVKTVPIEGAQKRGMMEVYRREIAQMSFREMNDGDLVGFLHIETADSEYGSDTTVLPVYQNMEGTVGLLKDAGFELQSRKIKREDVKSITICDYNGEEENVQEINMNDTKMVEKMLEGITNSYGILVDKTEKGITVEVTFQNGNVGNYYIYKDNLPK